MCKIDSSIFYPTFFGSKEVKVTEDDGDIVLRYSAADFIVKLVCDHQSAGEPIVGGKMILKSKEACPL